MSLYWAILLQNCVEIWILGLLPLPGALPVSLYWAIPLQNCVEIWILGLLPIPVALPVSLYWAILLQNCVEIRIWGLLGCKLRRNLDFGPAVASVIQFSRFGDSVQSLR